MRTREFVEKVCRGIRFALRLTVVVSVYFLGVTLPVHADAKDECTQGSLKGSFGYALEGLRFPSPPSPVGVELVAATGLIVFDGQGNLTAQDTFHTAADSTGVIGRRAGTGTYTVDPNCTGSGEIRGDYGGLGFYFSIFSRGKEFAFMITNAGTAQVGVAMTTGDEECTLATFKGTYANVRFHDYRAPFFSFVNAGLEFAVVDGKGNLHFPPVVQSRNGVFSHPTATGTYTVNSQCIETHDVDIVDGATTNHAHREGVVVDGGNQVWAVGATSTSAGLLSVGIARLKRISRHVENN